MKKIDFSKIVVMDIDGNPYMITDKNDKKEKPYDFAKVLGNGLFYNGQDIRISELGHQIYHHMEVEVTDEELSTIREFIDNGFVPFVRISVNPQLDELLK